MNMFSDLNKHRRTENAHWVTLGFEHMMPCLYSAWKASFSMDKNLKGWVIEGMIPFTRAPLWKKRAVDDAMLSVASASTRLSIAPAKQFENECESNRQEATLTVAPPLPAPLAGQSASILVQQPDTIPVQQPDSIPAQQPDSIPVQQPAHIPDDVKEALRRYEASTKSAAFGNIDTQSLIEENMALRGVLDTFATYWKTQRQPATKSAPTGPRRITSKDIFGRHGSATGRETMAMREKLEEAKRKKDAEDASKRDERDAKKRRTVAESISLGSTLLATIRCHGPTAITRLTVSDLQALLQNAAPQGTVPKASKAELLRQVQDLETVKAVVRDHAAAAASAVAAAVVAPTLPPPPCKL